MYKHYDSKHQEHLNFKKHQKPLVKAKFNNMLEQSIMLLGVATLASLIIRYLMR